MTASPEAPVRRLAVWAAVLPLLFAGLLAWVALNHGRPLSWDRALHAAALRHRAKPLIAAARPVSVGVGVEVVDIVSAVAGVLLLRPRSWWLGALAGVGALVVGRSCGSAWPPSSRGTGRPGRTRRRPLPGTPSRQDTP